MFHLPGRPRHEDVQPNRERLRALRDELMREMEATTYHEVKNKFLETLNSKRSAEDPSQRERGTGIWNKAFASTGMMKRSSLVLLAEFFAVEPEELIQAPELERSSVPPNTAEQARTPEVQMMNDLPVEPVLESLAAYWQKADSQGLQMRDLCHQLTDQIERRVPILRLINQGQLPDAARIREVLVEAARIDIGVRTLVLRISKLHEKPAQGPSKVNRPTARGSHGKAFTVEGGIHVGDLHISQGTLLGDVFNFGPDKNGGGDESDS
jgi:hypothetical protein